jgi:GTPase Era involved in 16S rRNA processing
MKYHPAKKEVSFTRFAAGKTVPIRSDSKLCAYMNERGKFVLQDHGNKFFEDIADAFDGEKSVEIQVVTTKKDFEDLLQMIEYYNGDGNVKLTATLLSELPDMNETYNVVRDHGEKSISVLKKHQATFFNVPLDNSNVKKCVEMFSADIQKEADSIREKIDSMSDNSINLCFAGAYSVGKSALINAILGYRILPEDITSETARMFEIQSPKDNKLVRVIFQIDHNFAELLWNEKSGTFDFGAAPTENNTRREIQETINAHKTEKQHQQIYEILKKLNTSEAVKADIKIFFPIPLDNPHMRFTIYDTPGTDSNFGEHQMVLQDALSEQTHSILIFVAAPDKIEGEGNNALLSYLKEAEKKDNKTSINIGRSLFVINKADTIDPDARKVLQTEKISHKTDNDFSIRLSDKKLFFVSATYAYSAKAMANGIATTDERYRIEDDYMKIYRPERGRYYRQNRVATSEYATERLLKVSEDELSRKEQASNTCGVFIVCSGLFALESEIVAYGEKYAAAVRAFAIIDSVDKALATMKKNAQSLERQNKEDINKINQEIEELRQTIFSSITAANKKYDYPANTSLWKETLQWLHLDRGCLQTDLEHLS